MAGLDHGPREKPASIFTGRRGSSHVLRDAFRNSLTVVFGEFCGTFMFLFLSFAGAQTAIDNNDPSDPQAPLTPSSLFYIASSFGSALAVNVWIFYRITGGMFNPAVTLGLTLVGAVTPTRALLILPTQIVAGICAAAVVDGILPGPLTVANSLGDGTSHAQGVFLEMFMTAQLVLTVYFLAVEKHRATFLAPIGIGISVFIAHIVGTNYTGTGINPARSFGPACIEGFVGYHWIYWLGPLMGSLLSYAVYSVFKWLEYKSANPGQDSDVERGSVLPPSPLTTHHPSPHVARDGQAANSSHHDRSLSMVSDGTLLQPSTTAEVKHGPGSPMAAPPEM